MHEVLVYVYCFLKENTDKGKPGRKRQQPLIAEFVIIDCT